MPQRKIKRFGWIPDLPDHRDLMFATPVLAETLPSQLDLTSNFPPVYNQGELGSCTANAIAGCIEYDLRQEQLTDFIPSRLFIYYNERAMEGTTDTDSGAMIRDGIKSINKIGFCPEDCWPYVINNFSEKPSQKCYDEAVRDRALNYWRLPSSLMQMKSCLASGRPFVFGFACYESLERTQVYETGDIPLPQPDEQIIGGHAIVAVGYDDARQVFRIRNSWGEKWGKNGYGTIPYTYLSDRTLAADFWVIQTVTAAGNNNRKAMEMSRLALTR